MGDRSRIAWTDATWNVVTGCTPVGEGCKHCYAKRQFPRAYGGPAKPSRNFADVHFHQDRLEQPLRWRKPRKVFACSMGDLFHKEVTTAQIFDVFEIMARCPQHTFQVLTKRPARARDILQDYYGGAAPLANVWVGMSVAIGPELGANSRYLEDIPAVVRFLSIEPLVGAFGKMPSWLDWAIIGAESGPRRRPCNVEWVEAIVKDCECQGIPVFVKQLHGPDGTMVHMPKVLGRVWDQFPQPGGRNV